MTSGLHSGVDFIHTDVQMWKDLLTSSLILRRRHINSSNVITPHLKVTCFFVTQTQHSAPLYGASPLNSATEVCPSVTQSAIEIKQQNGRAVLWFRHFVLGISPCNPGFDCKPVDPVDSASFLRTLRYFSLHSAPQSSQITTDEMQSWVRHQEIMRFVSSLFLDARQKIADLIYSTAEARNHNLKDRL